jgi:hypothetical protein
MFCIKTLISLHHSKLLGLETIQSLYRFFPQVKEYWYRFNYTFFQNCAHVGIVEQRARYFNVLAAFLEVTVVLIVDLIETTPLPADLFNRMKARLVMAYQLTDIQKVEKLIQLPSMGQQKPSKLLVEMLRFCPRGAENLFFFQLTFPAEAAQRVAHSLDGGGHGRQAAAHNAHLHQDTVAAVVPEQDRNDGAVAAVFPN